MIYSQRTKYALRALTYIFDQGSEGRVGANEIAEAESIPLHFLSKILNDLVRAKLLTSQKGPTGGFQLARDANEVVLQQVIEAFESPDWLEGCLTGHQECSDQQPCGLHDLWRDMRRQMRAKFAATTIADVSRWQRKKAKKRTG